VGRWIKGDGKAPQFLAGLISNYRTSLLHKSIKQHAIDLFQSESGGLRIS